MTVILGLRLQNIALIDSLELTFDKGLTVLTGETGAGKSILLDALDALMGGFHGTSGHRLLRTGADSAHIEADFLLTPLVDSWLRKESFLVDQSEFSISREWHRKENRLISRFRINGMIANRTQIINLRPLLIDITVQGQTQQLSLPGQQLHWLDRLGSKPIQAALNQTEKAWKEWNHVFLELQNIYQQVDELKKKNDELKGFLNDLEAAELDDPQEDVKLQNEEDRLVNGVRLQEGLKVLYSRLKEGFDEVPTVTDHLSVCIKELQTMSKWDSSLTVHLEQMFKLELDLSHLTAKIDEYNLLLESDPSRLDLVQTRLAALKRLQRRFCLDLPGLLIYRDQLRELTDSSKFTNTLIELKKKEELLSLNRDLKNKALTGLRKTVANKMEVKLKETMCLMGLENIRFHVNITPSDPCINGSDAIQFLFSANPGQDLAPLSEIASGGEMSRFLLALKTILSDKKDSFALLFDEIDAGVSGRISGAIAQLLKALSVNKQVFCVTHQPLIAAAADNHFAVNKVVENGFTYSRVIHLQDLQDRQQELAQLAGGDFVDARIYAASLLEQHVA